MKKCETCKHWAQANRYGTEFDAWAELEPPFVFRNCVRAKPLWDASEYDTDYRRVLTAEFKGRKFFAQDGSTYRAVVVTRNDFGCLEHEEDKKGSSHD